MQFKSEPLTPNLPVPQFLQVHHGMAVLCPSESYPGSSGHLVNTISGIEQVLDKMYINLPVHPFHGRVCMWAHQTESASVYVILNACVHVYICWQLLTAPEPASSSPAGQQLNNALFTIRIWSGRLFSLNQRILHKFCADDSTYIRLSFTIPDSDT